MSIDIHGLIICVAEGLNIGILVPAQRIINGALRAIAQEASGISPWPISRVVQTRRRIQALHKSLGRGNEVWSIQGLDQKLVGVQLRLRHAGDRTGAQTGRPRRLINVPPSEVAAQLMHLLGAQSSKKLGSGADPRGTFARADESHGPVGVDFVSEALRLDSASHDGAKEDGQHSDDGAKWRAAAAAAVASQAVQ